MLRPTFHSGPALALAAALSLSIMTTAAAQSNDADAGTARPPAAPDLQGLAWYRSVDITGSEIETMRDSDEVAQWVKLVDGAGASLTDLEYTYYQAFDPAALPNLGEMATVRVAGAETDALRGAVVQDIVDQVVGWGSDAPVPDETVIGDKHVVVVSLPDELGLADAIVYTSGDSAWVLMLDGELAEQALAQLP